MSDGDRIVRVRGGPKGVRHITLDEWKREGQEKRRELPPAKSPRQRKHESKLEQRRKKAARRKKKAKKKRSKRRTKRP